MSTCLNRLKGLRDVTGEKIFKDAVDEIEYLRTREKYHMEYVAELETKLASVQTGLNHD